MLQTWEHKHILQYFTGLFLTAGMVVWHLPIVMDSNLLQILLSSINCKMVQYRITYQHAPKHYQDEQYLYQLNHTELLLHVLSMLDVWCLINCWVVKVSTIHGRISVRDNFTLRVVMAIHGKTFTVAFSYTCIAYRQNHNS